MSFGGGGGTQGSIRYALIVDDAQATQKLNTFKTNLTGLATPTNNLNKNLAQLGTTVKGTSTSVTQMGASFKSMGGGLTQTTTLVNQQVSAQQKLGTTTLTTGKNVATMGNQFKASVNQIKSAGPPLANLQKTTVSLGSKIKDNASKFSGLATGLSATASGALQLAAGFRDYNDAQIAVDRVTRRLSLGQEALGKAQAKLNELQKSGKASSAELAQAQLDVTQAQKQVEIQTQLVGEAQERMFDSQTQFVASVVPTVLGAVGSLGAAFKAFGGEGGALSKVKDSLANMTGGMSAATKQMLMMGGAATAGAAFAFLIIDSVEKARAKWKALGVEFTESSVFDLSKMKLSQQEADEIIRKTGASLNDLMFHQEDVLKRFKEMGGIISSTGQVMITAKERVFDLGQGFKATSDQYITWSTNMFKDKKTWDEVMKFLTDSNIKYSDALKIAAFGMIDYNKAAASTTKTNIQAGASFDTLNRALDYQLGRLPGVTSAADEYAGGIDETAESSFNAAAEADAYNRALKYQEAGLPKVTSAIDEYAGGIDETAELTIKAAAELANFNRAIDYQLGRLPGVTSAADEYATGIDEGAEKTFSAKEAAEAFNRALAYQERGLAGAASAADEYALGIDESDGELRSLAETIDHTTPLLDAMRQSGEKFADSWRKFAESSRMDIADKLGLKGVDEKVDKLIKKFTQDLPNKINGIKVKDPFKFEIDEKAIGLAAGKWIAAFDKEIASNDKSADAIAKSIKKNLPKGDAGDAMKKFLEKAIDASNTGELLKDNLVETFPGSGQWTLKIPAETDFSNDPLFNPHGAGGFEMDLGGSGIKSVIVPAEAHVDEAIIGNGVDPVQTAIDAKTYTAKISRVEYTRDYNPETGITSYGGGPESEDDPNAQPPELDLSSMETNAKSVFTNIRKQFDLMIGRFASGSAAWQSQWSKDMNVMGKNTASGTKQSVKQFDLMIGKMASGSAAMAHQWSSDMNSMIKNTKSANSGIMKQFNSMIGKASSGFDALAHQWSADMNSMIKNAKAAASGVNKALAGIKDQTVYVNIVPTGATKYAQHGMHETLKTDTFIVAHKGERVDIGPAHQQVLDNNSGGGGGGGSIVVNLTNVNYDRETTRTFRREMGKELYRFGPT